MEAGLAKSLRPVRPNRSEVIDRGSLLPLFVNTTAESMETRDELD